PAQALRAHALKITGTGAGLVGAAAQEARPLAGGHARRLLDLLLGFDGAGASHEDEFAAAHLDVAHANRSGLLGLGGRQRVGRGRAEDLLHVRKRPQDPQRARRNGFLHLHGLPSPVAAEAAAGKAEPGGGSDHLLRGTLGCVAIQKNDQGPTPTKITSTTAATPKRRETQPLAVRTASPRAPRAVAIWPHRRAAAASATPTP